jgi:hypothetical protein
MHPFWLAGEFARLNIPKRCAAEDLMPPLAVGYNGSVSGQQCQRNGLISPANPANQGSP